MSKKSQQLANEINDLGDRLHHLYEQLKGSEDFKFYALSYPKITQDHGQYNIAIHNVVDDWVLAEQAEFNQRSAEASRRRALQS
jgi:hypothetical protein